MAPTTKCPGFEDAYRHLLATFPTELAVEERERIREDLRLHYDYRGEYVVFQDVWERDGTERRLKREVLAHSHSLDDLDTILSRFSEGGAVLRYVEGHADTATEAVPEEEF